MWTRKTPSFLPSGDQWKSSMPSPVKCVNCRLGPPSNGCTQRLSTPFSATWYIAPFASGMNRNISLVTLMLPRETVLSSFRVQGSYEKEGCIPRKCRIQEQLPVRRDIEPDRLCVGRNCLRSPTAHQHFHQLPVDVVAVDDPFPIGCALCK